MQVFASASCIFKKLYKPMGEILERKSREKGKNGESKNLESM